MYGKQHLISLGTGADGVVHLEVECPTPRCGAVHLLRFPAGESISQVNTELELWQDGELIQRALPRPTADQRETVKSGWCPACMSRVFS